MHQQNRVFDGYRIQILTGWMPLFLDSCIVIAPTYGPFPGFEHFLFDPVAHDTLDIDDGTLVTLARKTRRCTDKLSAILRQAEKLPPEKLDELLETVKKIVEILN